LIGKKLDSGRNTLETIRKRREEEKDMAAKRDTEQKKKESFKKLKAVKGGRQ